MKFVDMIAGLKTGKAYSRPEWPVGTLVLFKPRDPGGPISKIIGSMIRLNAEGDVEAFSATSDEIAAIDWTEV